MAYKNELEFEAAVVETLVKNKGWKDGVLKNPTEQDLIDNWKNILFRNNRDRDRLNDYPLTDTEMQQILDHIEAKKSPVELNGFINGRETAILRDNPEDKEHYGKEVTLRIYNRREIAGGMSTYQIAEQPVLKTPDPLDHNRRGDFMLLINGMPVIHVELKKSGIPVLQACGQIKKYYHEGVYTGIFRLIQIFIAMNPEGSLYFANPGSEDRFDAKYYFHWEDFNNDRVNDWQDIADKLMSIPMAHMMVGFYTVADRGDDTLKVMRSYQYYAANAISDRVSKTDWDGRNRLGGYIWHTTGSGKTMTSFKAAQLIANSGDADKVVFLMDRIELGTQSLKEYGNFAEQRTDVNKTENTERLVKLLGSDKTDETLIVTSIQKMSRIKAEDAGKYAAALAKISVKRIVLIIDECHRSTFGDMLLTIKDTFPLAMFFGFTGTPITNVNVKGKGKNTTSDIFGNQLHYYSIADGIRDKNVLGFDPYCVTTFRDSDVREKVALLKAGASAQEEALSDPHKKKIYEHYMDGRAVAMACPLQEDGSRETGIEDNLPTIEYRLPEHQKAVVEDIKDNWKRLANWYADPAQGHYRFHAILAASSIIEAFEYYQLIKKLIPDMKVTVLVDPNEDNAGDKYTASGERFIKNDALKEVLEDYKDLFGKAYDLNSMAAFKLDVSARLAHRKPYMGINTKPEEQLDLLIVVDQMLTGFDSKWLNTLYLDKVLEYEAVIQAFSRTNRLCNTDKPFGVIRYYRKPHTMRENIKAAVKLYSGEKASGLFVDHLPDNLNAVNRFYDDVMRLFVREGKSDLSRLPEGQADVKEFRKQFSKLNEKLNAAMIQGFRWEKTDYTSEETGETVHVQLNLQTYETLWQRYKEIPQGPEPGTEDETVPVYLTRNVNALEDDDIDADYMNSNFDKYRKILAQKNVSERDKQAALDTLHRSFAALSQEDQKYANIFLHDIDAGSVELEEGETLRDYIVEYRVKARNSRTAAVAAAFGIDEEVLSELAEAHLTERNINEYGRFDALKQTVDKTKARALFEAREGRTVNMLQLNIKIHDCLKIFILSGGKDDSFLS